MPCSCNGSRYLSVLFILIFAAAGLSAAGCQSDPAQSQSAAPVRAVAEEVQGPDSATAARFDSVMAFARAHDLHTEPLGRIMQTIGVRFRGAPYVAFPLDQTSEEQLVCRLDGFDCFTFVEAMLAMARGIKAQDYSFAGYAERTRVQRYEAGAPMGYCARLHYFSDWIAENEGRGFIRNITEELGGVRLDKQLDFMSTHRASYPRLAETEGSQAERRKNDSLLACIRDMEAALADLAIYHIPQDRIRAVYDQLRPGDIIAISTNIDGLGVSHTGLVYKGADGSTGLLHASSASGQVKVSPDLQAYVQSIDHEIGIVVARPVASGANH